MHAFLLLMACAAPSVEQLAPAKSPELPQPTLPLTEESELVFASAHQARELLGRHDEYIKSQSALERQIRLNSQKPVSSEEFLTHVQKQVLPWDEKERERHFTAASSLAEKMSDWKIPLPEKVLLIQTTGKDESDAAYTRSEGITLPRRRTPLKPAALERLLAHELFHVISRHAPDLRRRLYAVIGFQPCNPIELPKSIVEQKITNPDAPTIDYFITIKHQGDEVDVVPILLTDRAEFDPRRTKLFDYLQFRLMVVQQEGERWQPKLNEEGEPILIDGRANASYREQIGGNTEYIIHPDEIMADNFVHLLMQTKDLKSPKIVEQMGEIIGQRKEPRSHGDTEPTEEENN